MVNSFQHTPAGFCAFLNLIFAHSIVAFGRVKWYPLTRRMLQKCRQKKVQTLALLKREIVRALTKTVLNLALVLNLSLHYLFILCTELSLILNF